MSKYLFVLILFLTFSSKGKSQEIPQSTEDCIILSYSDFKNTSYQELSNFDFTVNTDRITGKDDGNDGLIHLSDLKLYEKFNDYYINSQLSLKNKKEKKLYLESLGTNSFKEKTITNELDLALLVKTLISHKMIFDSKFDLILYHKKRGKIVLFRNKAKFISLRELHYLDRLLGVKNKQFVENFFIQFLPNNVKWWGGDSDCWMSPSFPSNSSEFVIYINYFISRFEGNSIILNYMQSSFFRELYIENYNTFESPKYVDYNEELKTKLLMLLERGKTQPNIFGKLKLPYPKLSDNEKKAFLSDFIQTQNIILKNDISTIQNIIDLFLQVNSLYDDGSLTKTTEFWKKKGIETKQFTTTYYNKKLYSLLINEKDFVLEMGFYNYSNNVSDHILEKITVIFKNENLFNDIKKIVKYYDLTYSKIGNVGNSRYLDKFNYYYEQLDGEDFINMYGNVPYTALLEVKENDTNKYIHLYCSKGNGAFPFDLNKNKFQSETIRKIEDSEFLKIQKSYQHSIDVLTKFGESLETWLKPSSISSVSSGNSEKKVGIFKDFKNETKLQYQGEVWKSIYVKAQEKCPCSKYELNTGNRHRNNNRNGGVMALPYFTIYKTSDNKWYNLAKETTYSTYDELLLAIYNEDYE